MTDLRKSYYVKVPPRNYSKNETKNQEQPICYTATRIYCLLWIALAVLVVGLCFLVYRWPRGGVHATFSHHAATSRASTLYYVVLFSLTLPLLSIWCSYWFIPQHDLPSWLGLVLVAGCVFQLAAAVVAECPPNATKHRAITALSMVCMMALVITLYVYSQPLFIAGCVAIMVGLVMYAAQHGERTRYQLFVQAAFYTCFFAAIAGYSTS